ncbi:MAG: PAS domain S-box protein, partial [Desulfovibrionaceae bacterium]
MKRLFRVSLRSKILFSFLGVTLALSVIIAFLARWILVSSLTNELEMRGSAIAHSIAEHSRSLVLDEDYPKLLSLIVEEVRLGEREQLVSYIFIADRTNRVVSNTLFRPFPETLRTGNLLDPSQDKSVRELHSAGEEAYDIAVPIKEGLYRIGTVHVGLSKSHMDALVAKLRNTFLFFIGVSTVGLFIISNFLSRSIVKPLLGLTKVADEVSRGNFDVPFKSSGESRWDPSKCLAFNDTDLPCWHFDQSGARGEAPHRCQTCEFYKKRKGDEVVQLEDSFRNMLWSILLYRRRLRESEEKYRSLFNSAPDPTFVVDAENMRILDANPRAQDLYGYTKEELIGESFLKLGPDHESQYPLISGMENSETGCIYYSKVVHYKRGGEPFFVNTHACPISYQERSAIIIATTDITELIEKDAQL